MVHYMDGLIVELRDIERAAADGSAYDARAVFMTALVRCALLDLDDPAGAMRVRDVVRSAYEWIGCAALASEGSSDQASVYLAAGLRRLIRALRAGCWITDRDQARYSSLIGVFIA